ncbi:MAG TPA: type I phosphomannose isomerase catalytic subunit [Thermomicrobiaceae bacterium]|nr:type I phosphomannose isomerase catalytic subunit [Thermomicrobiaceae bacterium]
MGAIGYPLLLRPSYDKKIWGGRRLERVLGKPLPGTAPIGESLESGDAAVVLSGPLAGRALGELARTHGAALLGERGLAASRPIGDFPLLVKFIDASDILSIQVHPDDAGAPEGRRGKTEAWHVVAVEPGAELITGLTGAHEPERLRAAIAEGSLAGLLERRVVAPGDTLLVRAGTLHAIGAGVLLYEVQQNSDVTYRFYDWERRDAAGRPRELHLGQGLRALRAEQRAEPVTALEQGEGRALLAACRYFALERWQLRGQMPLPATPGTFRLVSCIAGAAELRAGGTTTTIQHGQTVLLPADLPAGVIDGDATLLVSSIPDLERDVVAPLRRAGHAPEAIARLDGGSGDLARPIAVAGA